MTFEKFISQDCYSFEEFQNKLIEFDFPDLTDKQMGEIKTSCVNHTAKELEKSENKEVHIERLKKHIYHVEINDVWTHDPNLIIGRRKVVKFEVIATMYVKEIKLLIENYKSFSFPELKEFKSELELNELVLFVDILRNKGILNNRISLTTMAEILAFISGFKQSSIYKAFTGDDIGQIRGEKKYITSLKLKISEILQSSTQIN